MNMKPPNEGDGSKPTMLNMTTSALVFDTARPGHLTQDMHRSSVELSFHAICEAPAISGDNDKAGQSLTLAIILDALRHVYPEEIGAVMRKDGDTGIQYPVVDRLDPQRTPYWQLAGVFENEGSYSGTYGVHDGIFLNQLGMRQSESPGQASDFDTRLILVHGDQLTTRNIRAVQLHQRTSDQVYARRKWLLPIPAWFHIQLNLLRTIVMTHWPADWKSSRHTLRSDVDFWDRSYTNERSIVYHQLESLVTQGFNARIISMFLSFMEDRRPSSGLRREDIEALTPGQLRSIIDEIYDRAFTFSAWKGEGHHDIEFTNMCRMLQEAEMFIGIRYALRHGDIGLLRRAVDPLIPLFFGAGQHNYGREMLWYRWLLSPANTPELQRAIMTSGLVNWTGKAAGFKPIDLGLEHLNGSCKIEMKRYRNSTHDAYTSLVRVCLTNVWMRSLRDTFERQFGVKNPGKHVKSGAPNDVRALGVDLWDKGLARPDMTQMTDEAWDGFESLDIKSLGMAMLYDEVAKFNRIHVRMRLESTDDTEISMIDHDGEEESRWTASRMLVDDPDVLDLSMMS